MVDERWPDAPVCGALAPDAGLWTKAENSDRNRIGLKELRTSAEIDEDAQLTFYWRRTISKTRNTVHNE